MNTDKIIRRWRGGDLIIRRMMFSDIEEMSKIVTDNYDLETAEKAVAEISTAFSPSAAPKPRYVVAEAGGELIGFAGYSESLACSAMFEVFWVNVRHDQQRKGVGRRVFKAAVDACFSAGAQIVLLTALDHLVPFYTGFAFRRVYEHEEYDGNILIVSRDEWKRRGELGT